jgi:hypothetical protein
MIRTNPKLWEQVKGEFIRGDKGGNPGQWSARKAQLAVLEYKRRGGGYKGEKGKGLVQWTEQDWTTRSGKPSLETGERYLPRKAIEALSASEYLETSRAKRAGMKAGKQFVRQPSRIADLVRPFREA